MHYANNQPAQAGDLLLVSDGVGETSGQQTIGVLTAAQSQSTTCNGQIKAYARRRKSELGWGPWFAADSYYEDSVTLSNCLPVAWGQLAAALIPPPVAVESKDQAEAPRAEAASA